LKKLEEIESHYPHQPVYDRYQIELRRIRRDSPLCQLFLRVDPSQWFNLEKKKKENENIKNKAYVNIKQLKKMARAYIKKVKKEHEDDGFRSDLDPDDSYKNLQNRYRCPRKMQVNGQWEHCGFYVKEDYCIYETSDFYAAARFNRTPVITICPRKHCQNEDWVQTPAAWNAVIEVLDYIKNELGLSEWPLHRICASFRQWHSQVDKDRIDGHAHVNVILTRDAIDACNK
jgi:hypothetical protein